MQKKNSGLNAWRHTAAHALGLRKSKSFLFGTAILTGLALNFPANAGEDKYTAPLAPKRVALVIGNSDYVNAIKLPGTITDADLTYNTLKNLDFQVTRATDVRTRADFLWNYWMPFLAKIDEGALAVFYFSGHGFTYRGESYLTPLDFLGVVKADDVVTTFMSVTALRDQMDARHPGVSLILLDACRNISQQITDTSRVGSPKVEKGLQPPTATTTENNIIIGFSSEQGAVSIGSADPNQASYYTSALAKHLPIEGVDFDTVKRRIRYEVKTGSQNKQVPWFSESSSAQIFLKPTPDIQKQMRDMWLATLQAGTFDAVREYLGLYTVSEFAAAARTWIADFQSKPPVATTRVSPATAEVAWLSQSPRLARRVEGVFALDRRLDLTDSTQNLSALIPLSEPKAVESGSIREAAEFLLQHRAAIVTTDVIAKLRPSDLAETEQILVSGTPVKVTGIQADEANKLWLGVRSSSDATSVFVSVADNTSLRVVDLGRPLQEVLVPRRDGGLVTTVDDAQIFNMVNKIRSEGRAITRISIATPKGATKRDQVILNGRATYISYLLAAEKIPLDRITVVQGADFGGEDIRVRIFGK